MKKFSPAFYLDAMETPVKVTKIDNVWYPYDDLWTDKGNVFIAGKGWIKISKTLATIEPLNKDWKAEDIQKIGLEYGGYSAMGMLQGWGNGSLFADSSYGLSHAKHEVINMVRYGKKYDEYTDLLHGIGNDFIKSIFAKGYNLQGKSLWYGKHLIGFTGMYETTKLHILQHVDHCLRGILHISPMFDPISFDKLLISLMIAQNDKIIGEIVSVHDRIEYLSSIEIADKFFKVFELEKTMNQ